LQFVGPRKVVVGPAYASFCNEPPPPPTHPPQLGILVLRLNILIHQQQRIVPQLHGDAHTAIIIAALTGDLVGVYGGPPPHHHPAGGGGGGGVLGQGNK
jgi:hypothetical protein